MNGKKMSAADKKERNRIEGDDVRREGGRGREGTGEEGRGEISLRAALNGPETDPAKVSRIARSAKQLRARFP